MTLQGEVVGDCGWTGPPDEDGAVEIGYGLAAAVRRQGLGTEAVAVLAAWAEQQPGVRLVTAEVLPGNEASLRLLCAAGVHRARLAPAVPAAGAPCPRRPAPAGSTRLLNDVAPAWTTCGALQVCRWAHPGISGALHPRPWRSR